MSDKQELRGGKRKGAGRKPEGAASKIAVTFRISPDVVEIIKSQPNQAKFVEEAIREKHNAKLP